MEKGGHEMTMETATLIEIKGDGQLLVLADGRRLQVNPSDIPTACIWRPTNQLQLLDGGGASMFPITVYNKESADKKISTAWWISFESSE